MYSDGQMHEDQNVLVYHARELEKNIIFSIKSN